MLGPAVAKLLQDFGSTLTLTRQALTAYVPSTGTLPAGAVSTFSIRGVFINYRQDRIDGTVVRAGDRMLLVSAEGSQTVPAIGDRVDGCHLVDVRTFAPNGVAVAWTCQARK